MSVFAFILLLLSGTHPDRRSRMCEHLQMGGGSSGRTGGERRRRHCQRLSHMFRCFNKWSVQVISHAREPGVYGER